MAYIGEREDRSRQKYVTVVVIVDRDFGSQIRGIVEGNHAWVIDSPVNRVVVEELWRVRKAHLSESLTIFNDQPSIPLDVIAASEIGTIEEHHPGLDCLTFHGVNLTPSLEKELRESGLGNFTLHSDGFIARR